MVPSSPPVILDGGLSTALEQRGADLTGSLWTARLLLDEPELVAEAHRDFYRAGAQVATAATYQATVDGFTAAGLDRDEAAALLTRAVRIAVEVRDEERDVVGETAASCSSPRRSGRTAPRAPTARSTAAATA